MTRALPPVLTSAPSRRMRGMAKPDDHVLVLFGATGDLARRKLLPGLWHLDQTAMLPDGYRIVGASEDALDTDEFRRLASRRPRAIWAERAGSSSSPCRRPPSDRSSAVSASPG